MSAGLTPILSSWASIATSGLRPGLSAGARFPGQFRASVVEIGIDGEQVEDEAFYDATSIAAMRIGCLPGNARNAVAMAAIAANTQADRKT